MEADEGNGWGAARCLTVFCAAIIVQNSCALKIAVFHTSILMRLRLLGDFS